MDVAAPFLLSDVSLGELLPVYEKSNDPQNLVTKIDLRLLNLLFLFSFIVELPEHLQVYDGHIVLFLRLFVQVEQRTQHLDTRSIL
jgi:hypothetical protein